MSPMHAGLRTRTEASLHDYPHLNPFMQTNLCMQNRRSHSLSPAGPCTTQYNANQVTDNGGPSAHTFHQSQAKQFMRIDFLTSTTDNGINIKRNKSPPPEFHSSKPSSSVSLLDQPCCSAQEEDEVRYKNYVHLLHVHARGEEGRRVVDCGKDRKLPNSITSFGGMYIKAS